MDRTTLIVVGLLALVAISPVAGAHAYLASSTPMPGGTVPEGTPVLALRFTEQIDPAEVEVRLVRSDGQAWPAQGEVPRGRPNEARIATEPLTQGTYELSWRVLSVDGHVEEGSLLFAVGDASVTADPLQQASGEPPSLVDGIEGLGRALAMVGVLATVGLPLFVAEVRRWEHVPRRVPTALVLLLGLALAGLGIRFAVLSWEVGAGWMETVGTRAGGLLLAQGLLVLAALGLVAACWQRDPDQRRGLLLVAVVPASLVVVVNSMGGHGVLAFSSREAVAGHIAATVHVLVVGLWGGGVLGFLLLRDQDGPSLAELVERFFPVGMVSVVVVALTGLYQAYVHLPEVQALWGSPYGRLLMAKTAGLGVLVIFGAAHQRWIRPRLATRDLPGRRFDRVIAAELAVLGLVVLFASVLAAAPLPGAPLDEGPGPVATFEQEAPTEDFWVRVALDGTTVETNETYNLTVELRPRTSIAPEEANVTVSQAPPDPGSGNTTWAPTHLGEGVWLLQGLGFDQPGPWTLRVDLDTPAGRQSVIFDLPVVRG